MCIHPEEFKECSWCFGNGRYIEFHEELICKPCEGTGCSANCEDCDDKEERK